MQNRKKTEKLQFDAPVLLGRLEKVMLPCGKENCACKNEPPQLHGPYYRWTGKINGQQTSRTLSLEIFRECQKRIQNHRKLKVKIENLLLKAVSRAPWND